QHAVLERPRLRFVGVADQVVRANRSTCHRVPLATGRKCSAAAAEQLRVRDLANHALRTELERAAQRAESARRPIAVDALGVDHADATQQLALRLWNSGWEVLPKSPAHDCGCLLLGDRGQLCLPVGPA